MGLNIPTHGNSNLEKVIAKIDASEKIATLWTASNVTAIDRMQINDHGPVHIRIVTNIAIKLLRLLVQGGVEPSVVHDHGLSNNDAEVIVCLAAALHDIGHVIHRHRHEELSLILAPALIQEIIDDIYPVREATIIEGEILHAILAHRRETQPLTIEAGVVKVADALDMESGRARIPFKAGSASIHAVSALAIKKVEIMAGDVKPVKLHILMSNSAGIFQLDTLLREKLSNSGLSEYVEVIGEVVGAEKKIVERYQID
jgi:uncharacterized protein